MQTKLSDAMRQTAKGVEADSILRKCVHCGFCLPTCPTYQLLGDERDGPRGRIYLIKQALEGEQVTARTRLHLDRCLTCRACETACPSGVQYGRLLDIGRELVDERVPRSIADALPRRLLRGLAQHPALFGGLVSLGRALRPFLPTRWQGLIPPPRAAARWPAAGRAHARNMLLLDGCVQPALAPDINAATARVLAALGIALVRAQGAGCCGAVAHHTSATEAARTQMRDNIDAWWPHIERGVEAIVVTASGCATMVGEYGHILRDEPEYAGKAARVSALMRDVSQVVAAERTNLDPLLARSTRDDALVRVAFHSPCSLQHGLRLRGIVEPLLRAAGYHLTAVADGGTCCGSAGAYSILEPKISRQLRDAKVAALAADAPHAIATANVGCLSHIQSGTTLPVHHWIELIARRLQDHPLSAQS